LYGLEYIPYPVGGSFARDLTTTHTNSGGGSCNGGNCTINTARWIITLPDTGMPNDREITIETRIGHDLTTGSLNPTRNDPTNLSRTYTWRGSNTWIFGDGTNANPPHLPITERFQIQGDPRHSPYLDTYLPYDAVNNPLGMGYNTYFDDFHNSAGGNLANNASWWSGFNGIKNDGSNGNDGWDTGSGMLEVDVNRIFQIMRSTYMVTNSVYTTITGFSYFYLGLGNEIGYDTDNGFPSSIPVSEKPYDGNNGRRYEDSIRNTQGVKYIRRSDNTWWAMHWLGELYPDFEYQLNWVPNGNLPSGIYLRTLRENINTSLPNGTTFVKAVRRTQEEGSTAFFNIGTTTSKYHHQYRDGTTGTLQSSGLEIATKYSFPLPTTTRISRPFGLTFNSAGNVPDGFQQAAYGPVPTATNLSTFYNHQAGANHLGSALLDLQGTGTNLTFIVVNGIDRTVESGSAFISRWSFLTLIQSFLAGGLHNSDQRIRELPRVEIIAPNDLTNLDDVSNVDVEWNRTWRRWDGQKYTDNYPDDFAEATPLSYVTLYSNDNGRTWRYMQDHTSALPGIRPVDPSLFLTETNYSWSTPAGNFPEGSYLIRIEAYRDDFPLHYSFHQRKIFLKRTN
jgi:hypothetical protein